MKIYESPDLIIKKNQLRNIHCFKIRTDSHKHVSFLNGFSRANAELSVPGDAISSGGHVPRRRRGAPRGARQVRRAAGGHGAGREAPPYDGMNHWFISHKSDEFIYFLMSFFIFVVVDNCSENIRSFFKAG